MVKFNSRERFAVGEDEFCMTLRLTVEPLGGDNMVKTRQDFGIPCAAFVDDNKRRHSTVPH